jgi:hypothetical protein
VATTSGRSHAWPLRRLALVHRWLDTWAGLGQVVAGMTHQGWDVQLTAYAPRDWRVNFLPGWDRALHRRRHGVGRGAVAGVQQAAVAEA